MKVEALLKDTRKILKKCSKLLTSHTSSLLSKEILKGELLEHQLFQLCVKEGVSLNQLQLLGHKTTFSQWRRNNNLQEHGRINSHMGTSKESPTLTVPPPPHTPPDTSEESPTLQVLLPTYIQTEPIDMSDPFPWLKPRHLKRLFKTSFPSHPTTSEDNNTTPQLSPPADTQPPND